MVISGSQGGEGAGSIAASFGTVKPALAHRIPGSRTSFGHMPSRSSPFESIAELAPTERVILGSAKRAERCRACFCSSCAPWHGPAIAETALRLGRAKSLGKQVCELPVAQTRCSCRRVRAGFRRRVLFPMIPSTSSRPRACDRSLAPESRSDVTVRNPMIFDTWDRRQQRRLQDQAGADYKPQP